MERNDESTSSWRSDEPSVDGPSAGSAARGMSSDKIVCLPAVYTAIVSKSCSADGGRGCG